MHTANEGNIRAELHSAENLGCIDAFTDSGHHTRDTCVETTAHKIVVAVVMNSINVARAHGARMGCAVCEF